MLNGHPGVFRPATHEHIRTWTDLPLTPDAVVEKLLPARQFVPTRPDSSYAEIADILNRAHCGIVFNTYDFRNGSGILHGNDRAREILQSSYPIRAITPESVKAALWLYFYGFENAPGGLIDGAYHRSLILGELHGFDTVLAAPPFPTAWGQGTPTNHFQVEDWKIKQWFSNSYRAESVHLRAIMDLVSKGSLIDDNYRICRFIEVPIRSKWTFFDYFIEKEEVFADAALDTLAALAKMSVNDRPARSPV